MERKGFTYKLIQDEAKFEKLSTRYHIVLIATLYSLLRFVYLKGEYDFFDLKTFEMSKLSFTWIMGVLAAMMASTYLMALVVRAYYNAIGSPHRIYEEMAMFYGFLTLIFFVMKLYGTLGFVCVLVSIVVLGLASYVKIVKAHQA